MRIAVDVNGLHTTQAGVARYIRGLLAGLGSLGVPDLEFVPLAWEVDNLGYRQPERALKTLYREGIWAPLVGPRQIRSAQVDLFHAPAGPLVRVPRGIRKVATAHDMAVFRYPNRYRRWQRLSGPRRLRALEDFDRVICISRFTADEAIRYLELPPSMLVVVHSGCDFSPGKVPPERLPDFDLPTEFLLFVGSLEPVKNLRLLRAAYEQAASRGTVLPPLVVVGARWLGVEGEGAQPSNWLYLGRQPDDVLVYLYRRALALVFPTLYEGFGFPLVEAMALGCPVICSRVASLPEVGGEAPLYADPTPEAYIRRIVQLVGRPTLRDEHVAAGLDRARVFSWRRCAEETLAVYRSVT